MKFSIRKILVFSFLLVTLVTITFGLVQRYFWLQKHERERVEQDYLPVAESLGTIIGSSFKARISLLQMGAKEVAEAGIHSQKAREVIAVIHRRNLDFKSVFICNADGRAVAFSPVYDGEGRKNIGRDYSDREYFKKVKELKQPVIGGIVVGKAVKEPIIPLAIPILDGKNELKGLIVAAYSLDHIQKVVWSMRPYGRGLITLTDEHGKIVVRSELETGDIMKDVSAMAVFKEALRNKKGIVDYVSLFDNRKKIGAFYGLENGWKIWIARDMGDVAQAIMNSFYSALFWSGVALLMAFIVAYFLSIVMARPVEEVRKYSERLASGDLEVSGSWSASPVHEINSLHGAFDTMALELHKTYKGLENKVVELQITKGILTNQGEKLRAVADASVFLSTLPFNENVYEKICDVIVNKFGIRASWLGIVPEGSSEVCPVASAGFGDDAGVWGAVSEGARPEIEAITTKRLLVTNDIAGCATYPEWRAWALEMGLGSSISVPLISCGGDLVGCLNLYSDRQDDFALFRVELLKVFAGNVSNVLMNRWLIEGLEKKVRERTEDLECAKLAADAATRAKSDFLANMSHELRTPLNSIIGFSELLHNEVSGGLNEHQHEQVGYIITSGKHLLSLINDILDLSKVEAGKLELELNNIPLRDLLNASMSMLKEKAMKHGIRLGLELAPDADMVIEADDRKIKQIMFNLMSNAVKFTPDGGSVRVCARKVESSEFGVESKNNITPELITQHSELNGNLIEISVEDTGIGIKPEDLKRLFKEFSQIESAYTKNYEGTGLGLALTKKLVELHGGRIWAESEFGKGSRFVFVIPIRQGQVASSKGQG